MRVMAEPRTSIRTYLTIYALLLILAAVTTALAHVDLASWSFGVAMVIAGVKALLVILYFMHLRTASHLTWVFAGAGFYFLGILLLLTLNDVLTRSWLSPFLGG
jgi:cytochrome c oxidase subunit 4